MPLHLASPIWRTLAGLVVGVAACASAGITQAQTLPALLQAALASDPAVAAASAQALAQEKRLAQVQAQQGPTVNLALGANDTRYNERAPGQGNRNFGSSQASLQITQPLFKPGQGAAVQAAQSQWSAAQATLLQARQESMLRLVDASFDALKARDSVQLLGAQRVATDEQLAAAQRKFGLGAAPLPDVREAEAQADLVRARIVAASQELELRLQVLNELTGSRAEGLLQRGLDGKVSPQVAVDSILHWIAEAQARSAQLQQAQHQVAAAKAEVKRAEQGHYPTVDMVGTLQRYGDTGTVVTSTPRRGDSAQLGINLNLPLYASGGIQARVEETRALQQKSESDLASVRRAVALNVRQAFSNVLAALGLTKGLEAALRSAEISTQANKRGYELGMKVSSDVLDAQSRAFEVRRDLSRARYDAWAAQKRLRAAAGMLDESDFYELETLLESLPAAAALPR